MDPGTFAATTPDKAAVIIDYGATMTYRELDERSNQLAHLLRNAGLAVGDHLTVVLENSLELFVVTWAAQRAGLYYTACSTRLTADELAYMVDDCGARVLVASSRTLGTADAIAARTPKVELRLLVGGEAEGWDCFETALEAQPRTPIADQAEGSDMLYSSGTTGRPKGVKPPLPSGAYPTPGTVPFLCQTLLGATDTTVYLSPAPLYHAAPLRFTMAMHRLGATAVVQQHFDPEGYLALIERHGVTFSQLVPTMFVRMLKLPAEVRNRYDLSSLQAVVHAAAPCPVAVKEQMIEWWGPVIHEYYAGTEGNGFVYCNSEDWLAHRGSVGKSLLGPLHILSEDGQEVPQGETGTVYFEQAGFEYHNDPEKTKGSRDPAGRGWSTLGDIGHLDADGDLFLSDRKIDMIISGGVNIYPAEIEGVLVTHDAVRDAAVFGIPNDEFGEEVKAAIELNDGFVGSDALIADILALCRTKLAGYKVPRSIDIEAALPRQPTGKLYKRLLRDPYWEGVGRSL